MGEENEARAETVTNQALQVLLARKLASGADFHS
jgi:hypothetical protein